LLTQGHVHQLTDGGDDGDVVEALTAFINAVLRGDIHRDDPLACFLLDTAFGSFIKLKPDGSPKLNSSNNPDLRPLGMGSALMACICRAAIIPFKEELKLLLAGVGQFGFCVSSGVEAVAVAVASWLETGDNDALHSVVATWDGRAAYSSLCRASMLAAIREFVPGLLHLYLFAYAGSRRMIWGRRSPGKHRIDIFECLDGTVQGCVLSCLGYCLATLKALRAVRAAYPDVFIVGIIDDTNFLSRNPARVSDAMVMYAGLMKELGVDTVIQKTYVTASDNCDISAGVVGATLAPGGGIPFVGNPVAPESVADSFAASFIRARLTSSIKQLQRLHLLGDPQLAMYLISRTFAPRVRFLATIIPGAWSGGRPQAGAAILSFAQSVKDTAHRCHARPLPARSFRSISDGGAGIQLIDSAAEHAYVFFSCQLRALASIRSYMPDLAAALLSINGPQSFAGRVAASRLALPPLVIGSTPEPSALFTLDEKSSATLKCTLKRLMRKWRYDTFVATLSGAEKMHFLLSTSQGAIGGLFLRAYSFDKKQLFLAADWNTAIFAYLGAVPPGLEGLSTIADPLVSAPLICSSEERIATHDGVRDCIHDGAKGAGYYSDTEVAGLFGPLPPFVDATSKLRVGEPLPGQLRTGMWRRMDNLVSDLRSGLRILLDATTPCGFSPARLRDWLTGSKALDAHVLEADRAKHRKYSDKPKDADFIAFVVGMCGEVNKDALTFLKRLGKTAAEHSHPHADPAILHRHAAAFTYGVKLKLSCALAKGKVEQYKLARGKLSLGERFGGCASPVGTVGGLSVGGPA
jgi:hypothetical protein